MFGLAMKMVFIHDDADNITQDTFIKVWKKLDGLKEPEKLGSWILKIAANESLMHLRKKKAMKEMDENEKDINKLIDTHFGYEQNIIDIKRNFYQELTTILPPQKIKAFFKAEQEFTRGLLRMAIKKTHGETEGVVRIFVSVLR